VSASPRRHASQVSCRRRWQLLRRLVCGHFAATMRTRALWRAQTACPLSRAHACAPTDVAYTALGADGGAKLVSGRCVSTDGRGTCNNTADYQVRPRQRARVRARA